MAFAYVLIKCKMGHENQIIQHLVKLPQVQEVKGVLGEWDIFVKLETDSQEKLEDIITNKIRKIPYIISTNSLSPIPSQGGKKSWKIQNQPNKLMPVDKIGIDLGGTKIEGILLDENYNILKRKRILTEQEKGYNSILERTISLIQELTDLTKNQVSVGIATPGALSKSSGFLKNSNTQCLIGKPLKNDLENAISKNIAIENDANCFALAEATMGAAKNFDFVFGIIMGTGVGGGIISNSKIHHGRTNIKEQSKHDFEAC